jgi:hypothetical protein
MTNTTTPNVTTYPAEIILAMSFELGVSEWKMAFSTGVGQPLGRSIPARDLEALNREIAQVKGRFGRPSDARVLSCCGAGRDGFWIRRALLAMGVGEPGGGFGEHGGEPARAAPEDGSPRCVQTGGGAPALPGRRSARVGGGPDAHGGGRGPAAAPPRAGHHAAGPHPGYEPDQVVALRAGDSSSGTWRSAPRAFHAPALGWQPAGAGAEDPPGARVTQVLLLTEKVRTLVAERRRLLRTATDPAVRVRQEAAPARRDRTERGVALRPGVLLLARVQEPQAGGSTGRADADTVPERR